MTHGCHFFVHDFIHHADFHKATQAMECIGLIAVLLAFLILLLYCFVNGCRRREALLATIFFIFGAGEFRTRDAFLIQGKTTVPATVAYHDYDYYYDYLMTFVTSSITTTGLVPLLLPPIVLLLITSFLLYVSVITMVIGYIIFGTKYEGAGYEVGWSMGVAIAGTVLIFIAGIMSVLQHMGR